MINSANITKEKVASHYDELDLFYREVWGNHIHHGYWQTGQESAEVATENLIRFMSDKINIKSSMNVCDIGCGYGATSRYLVDKFDCAVQALTISENQFAFATAQEPQKNNPQYYLQDWMENKLPTQSIDFAFSIESSEHMPDFGKFFLEASRVLKPNGKLAIFAWLQPENPKPWMVDYFLQPLCDEGRMRLATVAEYQQQMQQHGMRFISYDDISNSVSRTWTLCIRRAAFKILTEKKYQKFIFSKNSQNREFAKTLIRIRAAFAFGAMNYGLLFAEKI